MLFFHSKTAHQGLPNVSGDHVRLSVDHRHQKKPDPTLETTSVFITGGSPGSRVYENWESDELQHYWKRNERETVALVSPTEYE